jgi:integrase
MREKPPVTPTFQSVWAPLLEGHLKEKRAGGYRYAIEAYLLGRLDQFLRSHAHERLELSKATVEVWIAKRDHEKTKTYGSRVTVMRQFAKYLLRQGIVAYVPPPRRGPLQPNTFAPYIFTAEEIRRFLNVVDNLSPSAWSPRCYLVLPEIFRLLCYCGLRKSEAMKLHVKDVDLDCGVLTIRNTKFGKDRLVPMAASIVARLRIYQGRLGDSEPEAYFFPARDGGIYGHNSIYSMFRTILKRGGIAHHGRGRGPRLHDFRHTFAVQRLIAWYRAGEDLNAKLPLLATYLGHQGMNGTQRYLRMVPELFPEVTQTLENSVGFVIPEKKDEQ